MDAIELFKNECKKNIELQGNNTSLQKASNDFMEESISSKYSYNFSWMGRPIIQYPQDMIAMHEIIWETKPDIIIETGIAHGGSLIFYASMLELLGKGEVIGIDIDIRACNKIEIERHPMYKRIKMIEGSSVDENIVAKVKELCKVKSKVMVVLDSNHTHDHVIAELNNYSPLVTKGCFLVVFDTVVEDLKESHFPDRPWSKGNNPKTAVWKFLEKNDNFEIDKNIQNKLQITVAPDGYLKKIK